MFHCLRWLSCLFLLMTAALSCHECSLSNAWGQETPATSPDNPSDNESASSPPQTPPDFVYIPYEKLTDALDLLKSKVVISYTEYMDLLERVREQTAPQPPPAQAVISSARYTGTVKGEMAEITAVLDCLVLQERWAELPVQFGGAAIGKVTAADEKKVLLRGTGEGTYSLLFENAGPSQVTIQLLVPITRSPAGPTLQWAVPPVGITSLSLTIPEPDYEITVTPKGIPLTAENPEAPEKVSQVNVNLGATGKIAVSWSPRTSDRPEMDLLTTVQNQLKYTLQDGLVHAEAVLNYQILRGELTSLRIVVPAEQRILDVTASVRLQGWNVSKEEQRQVIEVQLLGNATESLRVEVHTEQSLPQAAIPLGGIAAAGAVHGIHALDVTREQGTLTLQHGEELSLIIEQQSGLVRTETSGTPSSQLSFRYFTPQFDFLVRAEPVQSLIDVKQDVFLIFREQRLESEMLFSYNIRRTGAFHLDMDLPEGISLTAVECPQMAEYQFDSSTRRLTLSLKERTLGNLTVRVRGHFPLSTDPSQPLPLPLATPVNVRQEEGLVAAYTVESIELLTAEDQLQSAQSIPLTTVKNRFPDSVLRAAWKFQNRPVVIPVRTIRRPSRMTAATATKIRVEPAGVFVETIITYDVQYAGIEHFRIAVPKDVSERIQIETAGPRDIPILQKNAEPALPEAEAAPEVVWLIQTQRPVTGRQAFRLTYDLPFQTTENPDDNSRPSVTEQIQILRPAGLEQRQPPGPGLSRNTGEIVLQVDPVLSVSTELQGNGLEPIDVRELTLLPPSGQQAARYPAHSESGALAFQLTISRIDVESVVSTVVTRMLTEFVAGTADQMAVRSRMRIKSSQRQRLQLQLPDGVQPMQVLVNREARQLQKGAASSQAGWTSYFVNVSRTGTSDEEFFLTLHYLQNTTPLSQITPRGTLNLPIPQLASAEGTPAVIQQSRCLVWLPDAYVPVRVAAPFERTDALRKSSFLRGIRSDQDQVTDMEHWVDESESSGFEFPTDGLPYLYESVGSSEHLELIYWNRTIVVMALTVALLLIALILMRTSWENRVMVVLITIVVLAAFLQWEPGVIKQGLHSARLGIVVLFGLWMIQGFFSLFHSRSPEVGETVASTPPLQNATEDHQ